MALESLGHQCVFASEIDERAAESYEANTGLKPAGDITKISADDVPDHDILCGGFPCQAFSTAGLKRGFDDTRGTLFHDVARIAKRKRPKLLLLENVRGLVLHDDGATLQVIINSLEEVGYRVYWALLDSADFNLPQSRIRIYFVCVRDDLDWQWTRPKPETKKTRIRDILQADLEFHWYDGPVVYYPRKLNLVKEQLQSRKMWGEPEIFEYNSVVELGLIALENENMRKNAVNLRNRKEMINTEDSIYIQRNRILHVGGFNPTLIKSVYRGSSFGAYKLDDGRIRFPTRVENKRLMSFPDDYVVSDGREGIAQLGNAVIPEMIRRVLKGVGGAEALT